MLRIHALGRLAVVGDGVPLAGAAAQPRRLALLALVARSGERGVSRDKAIAVLWADTDEDRARRALAQALYMLRRDLRSEELFLGTGELRLNQELITSDVTEFTAAIREGRLEHAVGLYDGPFLDGFRLPGSSEFERWADGERQALAHDYEGALERLARTAGARGDRSGSVTWWRKLAGLDPLNARHAIGYMEALVASGDRAGALQHARVYEAVTEQELDLPPDREVVAYASALRRESPPEPSVVTAGPRPLIGSAPVVTSRAVTPDSARPSMSCDMVLDADVRTPDDVSWRSFDGRSAVNAPNAESSVPGPATSDAVAAVDASGAPRRSARQRSLVLGAAAVVVLGLTIEVTRRVTGDQPNDDPVVAVGRITDYRTSSGGDVAKPLTDMLATNLARTPGLRVVSTVRMYELVAQTGAADTAGEALVAAARRAGATELVDGALYDIGDGHLRLDLRRVDLQTGAVRTAYSVSGSDAFVLADSGTAKLLSKLGASAPAGSVADVTTHSLSAYRLYEEGLRAYYRNDYRSAERLFEASLADDSAFAMAQYYSALTRNVITATGMARLRRAVDLADRASDRERLKIRASFADISSSPALAALAETLLVRFPDEVAGHLYTGLSLAQTARYLESVPFFRRVVAMDSLALTGSSALCVACDALRHIVGVYVLADSLAAAEREARRWVQVQPRSTLAWNSLATTLGHQGRWREALETVAQWSALDPTEQELTSVMPTVDIQGDQYEEAAKVARARIAGDPRDPEPQWYLALALRHLGRYEEALAAARRYRAGLVSNSPGERPGNFPAAGLMEGQVLLEAGRHRAAFAVFDSVASYPPVNDAASNRARVRVWPTTHAANALAAMGDTIRLAAFVDTVETYGRGSGLARDQRLHHHVRGLLFRARGRHEDAVREFRASLTSLVGGYTRTNLELARTLLVVRRPAEAIAVLQPALRGGVEASNLYVTRTDLHEALGQAWEVLGTSVGRDSAVAHYRVVARALASGDPPAAARAAAARDRLAALGAPADRPR